MKRKVYANKVPISWDFDLYPKRKRLKKNNSPPGYDVNKRFAGTFRPKKKISSKMIFIRKDLL